MGPLRKVKPKLHYPDTVVRFFLGENEPKQAISDAANSYFDAITSAKTFQVVPGTEHSVHFTQAGRDALIGAITETLAANR